MPRSFALLALAALPFAAPAADAIALQKGDRVVLLGSALIEREQRYAYWETALTARHAGVTFRNLGWSGDTVFGEARASFDPPAIGYKRLVEHTLAVKPTVILLGYGTNESFEGAAGLPKFTKQLERLLDDLAPTKARIILLSPLRQEDLGKLLPDPTQQNKNVRLYADAMKSIAEKRGLGYVDLYHLLGDGTRATPAAPYTDDALHLTAYGYWRATAALERGLGLEAPHWEIRADKDMAACRGATVTDMKFDPFRIDVTDWALPPPPAPKGAPKGAALPDARRVLCVKGLAPGRYVLKVDGIPVALAGAAEWAEGVPLTRGPEFDQAEKLRAAIIDKNHQYFYKWRPANETYLFGFRKHEQGQNAAEIPKFDPFIEKLEADIAKLRVPVTHKYELTPQKPSDK